ncbi:MAG: DsbA family protein [Pseudomonadota bacterium]
MEDNIIFHYFDYKSPYAYLAQEDTFLLESTHGVPVKWLPYTLDIPSYLGNATLDDAGEDTVGTRNAHQWRRVKYSYMDCRREANRRGLTIRGPQKIFDSTIAHMAFLYVCNQGPFKEFHQDVFERFWRRELDIENTDVMAELMATHDFNGDGFSRYCAGDGRKELAAIQHHAEEIGVFGVPSYVYRGQLFWGMERLPRLVEAISPN